MSVTGRDGVGGLAGNSNGRVDNVSLSGEVGGESEVGGMVGRNLGGSIVASGALGEVTGRAFVGGLVGENDGLVDRSFAEVMVVGSGSDDSESYHVGGLVGYNTDKVYNGYAIGSVSGENNVGGLVGANGIGSDSNGRIVNSYASGAVSGIGAVGGLVGRNEVGAAVLTSYALGEVSGSNRVGGLAGLNNGTVSDTYASGGVSAQSRVGGLVGVNNNVGERGIVNSYAIGRVSDVPRSGGLIGDSLGGVSNSYWNIETAGVADNGIGSSQTTVALQAGVAQNNSTDTAYYRWDTNLWDFGSTEHYPQLRYGRGDDGDNPACGGSGQPICGSVRSYGLSDLQVLGSIMQLSPQFATPRLRYRIGAYIGVTGSLRLIPNAASDDAMITIAYGGDEFGVVDGAVSTPIVPDPGVGDAIIVSVESAGATVEYILEIDYFGFDDDRVLADADDDGLIEITTVDDLYAIRYSLDGSTYTYTLPDGGLLPIVEGCPTTPTVGCFGYELTRDLDFGDAASYRSGVVNTEWADNWDPIGDNDNSFDAVFDGSGYHIRNLSLRGSEN